MTWLEFWDKHFFGLGFLFLIFLIFVSGAISEWRDGRDT